MSESKSCISIIILLSVENLISRKISLNEEKKNQTIPRNFTRACVILYGFYELWGQMQNMKKANSIFKFNTHTHTHKKWMEDTEIKSRRVFSWQQRLSELISPTSASPSEELARLWLLLHVQYYRIKAPQISINTPNEQWASNSQASVCVTDFKEELWYFSTWCWQAHIIIQSVCVTTLWKWSPQR